MKRIGDYLLESVYWLEVLYLLLAFLGLLAFAFNLIGLNEVKKVAAQSWKDVLLYLLAALSLIAFLHFLLSNLRSHRLRRMIRQESRGGPVLVSPRALRRLIREALDETGLEGARARVRLNPEREGLRVIVELKGATPGLLRTAGRLQESVKERVEGHVGLKVHRVEVHARSLRSGRVEAKIEEAPPEGGPSEGE